MPKRTFKVLANPGNGCWLVRVPSLGQYATVDRQVDIAPRAIETISNCLSLGDVDSLIKDHLADIQLDIEVLPKLSTYPIPARWLGAGVEDKINSALATAYGLPDYPGARMGPGRWTDLCWDPDHESPIARLWTNNRDGCGLLHVVSVMGDEYTFAALMLRHLHRAGVTAAQSFEVLASTYSHGPVIDGPLDDIADLDEEINVRWLI